MFRYPTPTLAAEAGYAIAGDRFAILLGSGVAEGVIARLWNAAAADTAVLEDVLSVLVAGGIHDLPDFAVAEFPDDGAEAVRVAVRGAPTARASRARMRARGSRRRWRGPSASVWRSDPDAPAATCCPWVSASRAPTSCRGDAPSPRGASPTPT